MTVTQPALEVVEEGLLGAAIEANDEGARF
jgi:hypothetical protein